jgi:alpha-ketoglutarate-dependent taurine dioxygenase
VVQVSKQLAQVWDVRLGVELERARVRQELCELTRAALAQLRDGHLLLLLKDQPVLLLRVLRLQALPGQGALQKVDQNVADGLEVVAAALLDAQVVVDGGVARRAGERAAITVGDVVQVLGVAVSF